MARLKDLWTDRQNNQQYAKWLFKYSKPYIGRILLLMILQISIILISLVMVQVTKSVIDYATEGKNFAKLIIVYIAIIVILQIVNVVGSLLSAILTERYSFGIRLQLYNKIIRSHWMDVTKFHTGDLMTRLTSDAGNIADGIVGTIPTIIQLLVELVLVFCMLFYYSPLLALLALLVAPVAALMSWWLGRTLKTLQVKVQQSEAKYRSFLQESLANLLIVKAFGNEDYSTKRLTQLREDRFFWVFKKTKLSVASSTTVSVAFELGYIAAFAYGAYQIYVGQITYGTMTVFLTLVNRVQGPVISLAQQIPRVVMILASAGRIMELQNLPLEEIEENVLEPENIGVKVSDLSFGYTDELVLSGCSLDIKPGEFVAIIGESGIGKTTLIRLIMSFMSNYEGEINFTDNNGVIEKVNASIRNYIAYVPQGNTLFSGTIRENILMGKHDAMEEEIIEALKLASGYNFVMGLPNGIDTVIGERGHGLSEGQAQRIAIARAFIRKSPFLILDEATSALDEKTELMVIEGLKALSPRPTCLIITHRKSILSCCDRELLIENKHLN